MLIEVKRFSNHHKHGTLSEMIIDGEFFCYGLEQDWEDDIPNKSCIPTGEYELVWFDSQKYGHVVAFVNDELGVTPYQDDTKSTGQRLFFQALWQVAGTPGCADKTFAHRLVRFMRLLFSA